MTVSVLNVKSSRIILALSLMCFAPVTGLAPAATLYVSRGGGHNEPYASWADAATNIQDALDAAVDGDTVLITNDTYVLSSQIVISSNITVSGLGDPPPVIDGNNSCRCVLIEHPGAVVERFRIRRGRDNSTNSPSGGGGVYMSGGILRDCTVDGCTAAGALPYGGGVLCEYGGVVQRCAVSSNSTDYGGGMALFYGGMAESCLVIENQASVSGGGVYLSGSSNPEEYGVAENCTIASNSASISGGGVYSSHGRCVNDIIYFNSCSTGTNYYRVNTNEFTRCCISPVLPGNIDTNPVFSGADSGNYRLGGLSPCIDAGTNGVLVEKDMDGVWFGLDGNGDGTNGFDIGAYEYVRPWTDSDGDGYTDDEEALAGTDGTDQLDYFVISSIGVESGDLVLQWSAKYGRYYTVISSIDVTGTPFTNVPGHTDVPGTDGVMEYRESAGAVPRFYRVRITR
ncbi:MAG: thrombospondin type 3 repeat-containing protein [Kiritimatiellia bacterium]